MQVSRYSHNRGCFYKPNYQVLINNSACASEKECNVGECGRKQKQSVQRASPGSLWRLHTWFDLVITNSQRSRSRVVVDRRCRSPQLGFTTSQPRGCIPSSAPQTTLREEVEQPPQTVSRTALREDLRNSNGHSDSPSGGPSKLGRSHGQPFGRHSRTKTETMISLQSCTHTVSSIRQGFAVQN